MKRLFVAATFVAVSAPAWAQTAVGVGVAKSDSTAISGSRATAISGQGGAGGTGIGVGGNPTSNVTINSGTPSVITSRIENTGTSTVKNVPSVFAPGLAAAGLETCLGSVSGGGSFVGTGFSFGSTIPDPGCAARLDARTLWSMGLKRAAIARLCLGTDIRAAMPEVCGAYLPQAVPQIPTYYGTPAPLRSYYLSEGETYKGGPIQLTDGRTGKDRLCNDYNSAAQRCRVWADAAVSHAKPKKAKRDAVNPVASLVSQERTIEQDNSK